MFVMGHRLLQTKRLSEITQCYVRLVSELMLLCGDIIRANDMYRPAQQQQRGQRTTKTH